MKLSMRTILILTNALTALDGTPNERKPYKLSAKTRMAIGKNLARLHELQTIYQKIRNGLIYEHADGGGSKVADDRVAEFEKKDREFLDQLHDVELETLTEAQLHLDDNQLPGTVIANLAPILKELMPVEPAPQPAPVHP